MNHIHPHPIQRPSPPSTRNCTMPSADNSMTKKAGQGDTKRTSLTRRTPNINGGPPGAPTIGEAAAGTITVAANNAVWRPNNVPIVKTDNHSREGFLEKFTQRQERFVSDASKWCVGPMPVNEFLQAFFPSRQEGQKTIWKGKAKERMPTSRNAFRSVPITPASEQEVSRSLVGRLYLRSFCFLTCLSVRLSTRKAGVHLSDSLKPTKRSSLRGERS